MRNYLTSDEFAFIAGLGSWAGMEAVNRVRRLFGLEPIDRDGLIALYLSTARKREWGEINGALCIDRAQQLRATVRLQEAA